MSEEDAVEGLEENQGVGDEKQVRKRKTKFERLQDKNNNELQRILSQREGRALLWRVISKCGVYQSAPDSGMARFEGGRDIGLWLLAEFHQLPSDYYSLMKQEAQEDDKNFG